MRCDWADHSMVERAWHDEEWCVEVRDERRLFEYLVLKGAQAGLAWRTVLSKRATYRQVFHQYDIARIAAMTDDELAHATADRGIIRHRLKVASVRHNARMLLQMREQGEYFPEFLWNFVGGEPRVNMHVRPSDVPMRTETSDRMSAALRQRGFTFAGTAICYGVMQAAGMVNDHLISCDHYR